MTKSVPIDRVDEERPLWLGRCCGETLRQMRGHRVVVGNRNCTRCGRVYNKAGEVVGYKRDTKPGAPRK